MRVETTGTPSFKAYLNPHNMPEKIKSSMNIVGNRVNQQTTNIMGDADLFYTDKVINNFREFIVKFNNKEGVFKMHNDFISSIDDMVKKIVKVIKELK